MLKKYLITSFKNNFKRPSEKFKNKYAEMKMLKIYC